MKTCPQCQFNMVDHEMRCPRCGTLLRTRADTRATDAAPLPDVNTRLRHWRPQWHWRLLRPLGRWRYRFGLLLQAQPPAPEDPIADPRNPWLAGALSLLPGLGQLYNRRPVKALVFFAWVGLWLFVAWLTLHHPFSNWILLILLTSAVFACHEAFIQAKLDRGQPVPRQHNIAFYSAWIFYIAFTCIILQLVLGFVLFRFRYVAYDHLSPYLNQGEKIAIDCLSRWYEDPEVGDVVYYNPGGIVMERPQAVMSDTVPVNPQNAIERVVGGPGDTFERRNGAFYLNGNPVPPSAQPIVQHALPPDFQITAGPDQWIVLFSYTGTEFLNPGGILLGTGPHTKAPPLFGPGWIVKGWDEACLVRKDAILGDVLCVYQPPPARRWLN